ncbi:MAG: hypothetical protein J3Q66DRAFT_341768 [Benniella sp.]|nr:MAG: hypothetical protein J3Q66DRAFT_341768 [Benniella sp.]
MIRAQTTIRSFTSLIFIPTVSANVSPVAGDCNAARICRVSSIRSVEMASFLVHSFKSSFAKICSIFLSVHWVSSRLASILASQSDSRVKAMSYR